MVEVEVDTLVKDGVVDVGVVCNDEYFLSAGFGGGAVARKRWGVLASGGISNDIDRPRPFVDRWGVRDKCNPIDICSTVGTHPARSSSRKYE